MENLRQTFAQLGLTPPELESVCARFKPTHFAKNEYLLQPGQVATKLFFVESGGLLLGNEANDQLVTHHLANANEFITSLQSFDQQLPTTDFLKAVQPSRVYAMTKTDFMAALNRIPRLETFYHQMIFTILLNCQQRIRDLVSLDAKTYYQQLQQNKPQLVQNMAQQDLASYLGIEPQSLSRLRKPS